MRKKIEGHVYDTKNAKHIGYKHIGEYGQPDGYEEQLYITEKGQYFIYGKGGSDSLYPEETIKLITEEQAAEAEWVKENVESSDIHE